MDKGWVLPESSFTKPSPSRALATSVFPGVAPALGAPSGLVPFSLSLLSRPYVDLVNLLLTCGEEVKEAITHSVQAQCEQSWGSLCSILSFCTSAIQRPPTVPPERRLQGDRARLSRAHHEEAGHHLSEPSSQETGRGAKGERGSKSHPNTHARGRAGGHGAQGTSGSSEWEDEQSEYSDIRR